MGKMARIIENEPANCLECELRVWTQVLGNICPSMGLVDDYIVRGRPDWCPLEKETIQWFDRDKEVPSDDRMVLVTVEQADGERFISIDFYSHKHLEFGGELQDKNEGIRDAFRVVAWAERPEPWKGGRENG